MEPNFITEVAKALDALSVERLVRTTPLGSVRCKPCGKNLYTYAQARYMVLKRLSEEVFLDVYRCPEQEGENYHLRNLDKRAKNPSSDWIGRMYAKKKKNLIEKRQNAPIRSAHQYRIGPKHLGGHRPYLVGSFSGHVYTKALRAKIVRALEIPLSGLRKPRTHPYGRGWNPGRRIRRSWQPRLDLPRGETVTKMMSWANADKYHTDSEYQGHRPKGDGDAFRRRVRARETEAVRKEAERELGALEPLQGPEEWCQHRCSTNQAALGSVDFDGSYTVE